MEKRAKERLETYREQLPHLLAEPELNVMVEKVVSWTYTLSRPYNDLNIYIAPDVKYAASKYKVEECLFLPITTQAFSKRWGHHVGYQLDFAEIERTTAQLLDDAENAISTVKFEFAVRRFEYHCRGKATVILDRIHDPLFPIRSFEFSAPATQLREHRSKVYLDLVAEHCLHFVTNDI